MFLFKQKHQIKAPHEIALKLKNQKINEKYKIIGGRKFLNTENLRPEKFDNIKDTKDVMQFFFNFI